MDKTTLASLVLTGSLAFASVNFSYAQNLEEKFNNNQPKQEQVIEQSYGELNHEIYGGKIHEIYEKYSSASLIELGKGNYTEMRDIKKQMKAELSPLVKGLLLKNEIEVNKEQSFLTWFPEGGFYKGKLCINFGRTTYIFNPKSDKLLLKTDNFERANRYDIFHIGRSWNYISNFNHN